MIEYLNKIIRIIKKLTRKEGPSIRIGRASHILSQSRKISYHVSGRSVRTAMFSGLSWKRTKKEIRIFPEKEPNPHIVIVGMSGYGKSTLFKSILMDISKMPVAAIVFDAHNEHESVVRSLNGNVHNALYSGINILELNGESKSERISEIVSLLKGIYSLGHIQATKLGSCLYYTYRKCNGRTPTISDLVAELNIFISNAKTSTEKGTLQHLKDKINLINTTAFVKNPVSVDSLSRGINSFSLAGLRNPESRIIYIHELLKRIYSSMKDRQTERGLKLFIMVDEAQFLLSSQGGFNAIRSIVEEGRKYGAGVIIATHITANLDRQILANASTLISFYSRDPSEVNYIANAMSGNESYRRDMIRSKMRELKQNEAMMITGTMKSPVVVRTPSAKEMGTVMNAAEAQNKPEEAYHQSNPIEYEQFASKFGKENTEKLLSEGILAKERLTDGKTWVMKKGSKSVEHERQVSRIASRLSTLGVRHYIQNNSKGPDLVAYMNGVKTAIEYETGRKRYKSTMQMLYSREKEFKRIIVFVNSRAYNFYKSYFHGENAEVIDIKELDSFYAGGHISPEANTASPPDEPSTNPTTAP